MRKTFEVKTLLSKVNSFLLNSADEQEGDRRGQIIMLESVLYATGNYCGFTYLNERDMEESNAGSTVGIRCQNPDGRWNFNDTDSSRVIYF